MNIATKRNHIQLDWNFIGKIFNDDEFFSDYDKNEIPSSVSGKGKEGDRDDYLRNDDKCAGSDGSISKSNCRTPPRCNKETSSLGKQKLCINRSFEPDKRNSWYVAILFEITILFIIIFCLTCECSLDFFMKVCCCYEMYSGMG